jgi:thioredoxin-related protein
MEAQPTQPKSKLDTAANVAIILVCIIAAAILIRNNFFPPTPPPPPGAAAKGDTLAALREVIPPGADRTLVVALSPTCHFCNESMPFYKTLVDQRNQSKSPVKVVAAVPMAEAREPEQKNLADHGVQPDAVVPVDFAKIKVPGTPTVLLVDNQGKVLDVWVGKLTDSRQKQVLANL